MFVFVLFLLPAAKLKEGVSADKALSSLQSDRVDGGAACVVVLCCPSTKTARHKRSVLTGWGVLGGFVSSSSGGQGTPK